MEVGDSSCSSNEVPNGLKKIIGYFRTKHMKFTCT